MQSILWIMTINLICVYREAISALWSKSWQIAWIKPSRSEPSCRKISTQWNLSFARYRKKSQKSPVRMNTFQVSLVRPKIDRLSSKFCDHPTNQPTDKLIIFLVFQYSRVATRLPGEERAGATDRRNGNILHQDQRVDQDFNLRGAKAREALTSQDGKQMK